MLKEYHGGQAPIGLDKNILSTHFWFPRMGQLVKKYNNSCLTSLTLKRLPRTSEYCRHSILKVTIPRALQNDEFILEWDIERHFITPYFHPANGQVERLKYFVANLLRVQNEVTSECSTVVSHIQLIIKHKTTKRTPLQTLLGLRIESET